MVVRSTKRKVALFIIALILIIIGAERTLEFIIKNRLDSLKVNLSEYNITYADIDLGLLYQDIIITDIKVSSKTRGKDSLLANEEIYLTVKSLNIEDINIGSLVFFKSLKIDKVLIDGLKITSLKKSEAKFRKAVKEPLNVDVNHIQLNDIDGLHIGTLKLIDFSYEVNELKLTKKKQRVFHVDPVSFEIKGINLDQERNSQSEIKSIVNSLEIPNMTLGFDRANYKLSVGNIKVDFMQNLVFLQGLQFYPTLDQKKLAQKYKYSKEVFKASIDSLRIVDTRFKDFFEEDKIKAEEIYVSGLDLNIYKDKNKPDNTAKIVQLPHIMLKETDRIIDIPQLNISKSSLKIQERIKDKDTVMELYFDNINANLLNLSNQTSQAQRLTASVQANLMGRAPVNLHFNSRLSSTSNKLYWGGSVGSLKFKVLDRVLFPALGLKILKGQLDKIQFSGWSDGKKSEGTMTMYYHDLKASILKSKSLDKENSFLSFIANGLARSANPNKRGKVKTVVMYHEKDPHKGMGNDLWKTIQSGIVNTISPFGKRAKKTKDSF